MEIEILNVKETAKFLNCSQSLLRKLIRNNKIKFFRLGSKILFRRDDLYDWIESNSFGGEK